MIRADLVTLREAAELLHMAYDRDAQGGRERALDMLRRDEARVFDWTAAGVTELTARRWPLPDEIDWERGAIEAEKLGLDSRHSPYSADHPIGLRLLRREVMAWRRAHYPGEPETAPPSPSERPALPNPKPARASSSPSTDRLNQWMLDYAKRQKAGKVKRDDAIKACMLETGATWRAAEAAYKGLPPEFRYRRGAPPKSSK